MWCEGLAYNALILTFTPLFNLLGKSFSPYISVPCFMQTGLEINMSSSKINVEESALQ